MVTKFICRIDFETNNSSYNNFRKAEVFTFPFFQVCRIRFIRARTHTYTPIIKLCFTYFQLIASKSIPWKSASINVMSDFICIHLHTEMFSKQFVSASFFICLNNVFSNETKHNIRSTHCVVEFFFIFKYHIGCNELN